MKKRWLRRGVFTVILTILPCIPALLPPPAHPAAAPVMPEVTQAAETEISTTAPAIVENEGGCRTVYRVLQTKTGEIAEIPVRDYLIGAVGAEMPASFSMEALKAQVVAAHTYAERQAAHAAGRTDLKGADFSDDPAQFQAYLPEDALRERWGENAQTCFDRIDAAVEEAGHLLLEYDGEPIIAAFHAMSSGKTESAEAVWGKDVVYLRSVESPYDRDAPRFEDTLTVPAEEVFSTLTGAHAGLTAGGDASEWFGEPVRTDAGTVLQIAFGDGVFTGQEIRSLFCLRSADFSVDYADGAFIFTTCGYGHAVGMSQYGADAMARRGYTFREILAHYYPGAELVEVE